MKRETLIDRDDIWQEANNSDLLAFKTDFQRSRKIENRNSSKMK